MTNSLSNINVMIFPLVIRSHTAYGIIMVSHPTVVLFIFSVLLLSLLFHFQSMTDLSYIAMKQEMLVVEQSLPSLLEQLLSEIPSSMIVSAGAIHTIQKVQVSF